MSECSSGSSPWESRMKRTVHLKEFGIRRDNASPAIAEAIAAAGEGGTVVIDSGVWQTGPVDISSPCRIIFEDGAVLSMIPDVHLYRPCNTRWEGADCYGFHPCFMIHDISIERVKASGCRASIAFIAGLPESRAEGITISDSSFALADHGLADPSLAELTSGLPESSFRGILVRNADIMLRNTDIKLPGSGPATCTESGGTVTAI